MVPYERELRLDRLPPGFDRTGPTNKRTSIRGVAQRDGRFLLLFIARSQIYEFPGGGIEGQETHRETLVREMREETGYATESVGPCWLKLIETSIDRSGESIFEVNSFFYPCSVSNEPGDPSPEPYEVEAGTVPVWETLDHALATNAQSIDSLGAVPPAWMLRAQEVLALAKERFPAARGL